MNAHDWLFFAEGGAHIVFRNVNEQSALYQFVLKVPKVKPGRISDQQANLSFVTNTIQRWFSPKYIGNIHVEQLSDDVFAALETTVGSQRSVARSKAEPVLTLCRWAYLERNLCNISSPSRAASKTVTYELKVKCGLKACSPFVPAGSLKEQMDKFSWMQRWKQIQRRSCHDMMPWGQLAAESSYCPRDLCSGDRQRVRGALQALMSCPQNNLKISLDGVHVYGWDKPDISSLFASLGADEEQLQLLSACVAEVVSREPLLRRLELMQCLDLLDTEGAHLVYHELERRLPAGALEGYLSDHFALPSDLSLWEQMAACRHSHSLGIETIPIVCASDDMYCAIVALSVMQINASMSSSDRSVLQADALDKVMAMTNEQLAELLKMTMTAMIARDASVIISLRPMGPVASGLIAKLDDPSAVRVALQTDTQSGSLDIADELSVEYTVGVIDVSLKAVSKLTSNLGKERSILAAVSSSMM